MNPVDDFLEGFKEQPSLAVGQVRDFRHCDLMGEATIVALGQKQFRGRLSPTVTVEYFSTVLNRKLKQTFWRCDLLKYSHAVEPSNLTPQQRAFLDTRLGASLVVLASDFRHQFNTTAEQTCALIHQWANT